MQQHVIQGKENGLKLLRLEIQKVLSKFEKVFEEPCGLPPIYKHEHRINIKEGMNLINI